jgi:acetyl-CoA carboxylase biotin carboxyl carrier protein
MGKLQVDTELIEALAQLLQRTGLTEIELAEGDARIRVAREAQPVIATVASTPAAEATPRSSQAAATAASESSTSPALDGHPGAVRAPMVGTAYLTPEPGAPPFVSVGDEVQGGATLLIIEAMKVMNPIRAPKGGRVARVMVGNGDPVEYGELLLVIE